MKALAIVLVLLTAGLVQAGCGGRLAEFRANRHQRIADRHDSRAHALLSRGVVRTTVRVTVRAGSCASGQCAVPQAPPVSKK